MTVIDVFLDRPRVVPKHREFIKNNDRVKLSRGKQYLPELTGCIISRTLPKDTNNTLSMEGNGSSTETDVDTRLITEKEENNVSSLSAKKQKLLLKSCRTPVRNRRKSRWKLKFHHQALPPEYLRHYRQQEKKRRQSETSKSGNFCSQNKKLLKKSSARDKEAVSDETKRKDETSEVSAVKVEDIAKERESTQGSSRLKRTISSQAFPASSFLGRRPTEQEVKAPHSPVEMNPQYGSAEKLFRGSLSGVPHLNIDVSQNKAFLENLLTNQIEINRIDERDKRMIGEKNSPSQCTKVKSVKQEDRQKGYSIPPSGKIMNYSDLPYMGEITLDGIKPRRGRKPKKADICHLIYKNYGQVFPGAPEKEVEECATKKHLKWRTDDVTKSQMNSSQRTKGLSEDFIPERLDSPLPTVSGLLNHTEVQNRIINSLLEKRLTQGVKADGRPSRDERNPSAEDEEPLNLCIRDLRSLKIKLTRRQANVGEAKERDAQIMNTVRVKSEIGQGTSDEVITVDKSDSEFESSDDNEEDDLAPFNLVTTELRDSSDDDTFLNLSEQVTLTKVQTSPKKSETDSLEVQMGIDSSSASTASLWPENNFFLAGTPPASPLVCSAKLPDLMTSNLNLIKGRTPFPGQDKRSPRNKSEEGRVQLKRMASNNGVGSTKPAHVITKRKRSAIFIPPVPAESATNPTTEVSICKFKFTGGAKPSLQEKKMLSVDSGGNFRYYSGTGDKSMRGYEYFPRESLQQCQENTGCSPSGVFLTASALGSGEKIPEEIGHSGFFDPDFPLQVATPRGDEKSKSKSKSKKSEPERKPADLTSYRSLRDHLLTSKSDSPHVSILPEMLDDGNSSDQSGEGFDYRNIPQRCLDSFKLQESSSRILSRSEGGSSRNRKLRRTRKSLAREKLEQTFKEKGFLIQTQQLESAEGATYCKFRQLRKFTRYLFRSWKDYLPGNVRNLSVDAGVDNPEILLTIPETNVGAESSEADESKNYK